MSAVLTSVASLMNMTICKASYLPALINVKPDHLALANILIGLLCLFLWWLAPQLDVLHLGNDHAVNLGIELRRLQLMTLFAITAALSVSRQPLLGRRAASGFIVKPVLPTSS